MDLMEKIRRAVAAIEAIPSPASEKMTIFTTARPAIEKALKEGKSLKKISETLAEQGVPISVSMLRNYMQAPAPTKKAKKAGVSKISGGSSANLPRTDTPSSAPMQKNVPGAAEVKGVTNSPGTSAHSGQIHEDF
jgi:hypothetical protein